MMLWSMTMVMMMTYVAPPCVKGRLLECNLLDRIAVIFVTEESMAEPMHHACVVENAM